ncbi:MAG TPA: hypothetical protein VG734_13955, partial [Lacunisphaera sp.]|nr:hypothetical protein [Lacunisphaera sp.]
MSPLILVVAIVTLAIGATVYWANPHRLTNRAFLGLSFINAGWLCCVFMAQRAGALLQSGVSANPIPWVRAASAVGAYFPLVIWAMKESILSTDHLSAKFRTQALVWFGIGCALASLCFTRYYIPPESRPGAELYGLGYHIYTAISLVLYLQLIIQTFSQWRTQTGIRKLEIQFLILNAGIACFAAIFVTVVGIAFELRFLFKLTPLIILVFYGLTAWSVTIHRVFDARQIFLQLGQRTGLICALTIGIYGLNRLLESTLQPPADLIVSIAISSTFAFWLHRKSREWFSLNSWQHTATTRQAALEIARRENDPNKLVTEFEALLRSWNQAGFAALLFDSGEIFVAGDVELTKDRPAFPALIRQGWTTPEALQRQRPEPGLVDLRQFVTEFNLGLIVTAPRGSATPSLLLALGIKSNRRPFTYPEVQQVQEVAEFMDNILARSRLSRQARQSEQLATIGLIGASLAHEIRNPLVSIKTFSHLLPSRFDDP